MKTSRFFLTTLFVCGIIGAYAQMNHLGFPNMWAYYPSLDYVRMSTKQDNKEVTYGGYGFTNRGSFSLLSLIFKEQRFFIHENLDFSLVGISMGNRIVKKPGAETEKSFSAGIALGFNGGICAGYVADGFAVGVNYTLIGGTTVTDLEYNFTTTNAGLTELRVMVGPFMGQIGHSFNYKRNRMWNGMLAFWFGDDPEDAHVNIFFKGENNSTLYANSRIDKFNIYSLGVTLVY